MNVVLMMMMLMVVAVAVDDAVDEASEPHLCRRIVENVLVPYDHGGASVGLS